jgi:hypothetical protein
MKTTLIIIFATAFPLLFIFGWASFIFLEMAKQVVKKHKKSLQLSK